MLDDIVQSKFLMVLLSEEQYMENLAKLVKALKKTHDKVCYVCLSKPYSDVVDDLRGKKIDPKAFFFIDVLSSHYGAPEKKSNCIFLDSPELGQLRKAVDIAIKKNKCSAVIFDTVSALLMYHENFSILKFAHGLTSENKKEDVKNVFIVLKRGDIPEKDSKELIDDLGMFADKTVDMG